MSEIMKGLRNELAKKLKVATAAEAQSKNQAEAAQRKYEAARGEVEEIRRAIAVIDGAPVAAPDAPTEEEVETREVTAEKPVRGRRGRPAKAEAAAPKGRRGRPAKAAEAVAAPKGRRGKQAVRAEGKRKVRSNKDGMSRAADGRRDVASGKRPTIKQACAQVLGNETLDTKEVVARLEKNGWMPNTNNPAGYINFVLSSAAKKGDTFERVDRGQYRVKGASKKDKVALNGHGESVDDVIRNSGLLGDQAQA
jgi:uncharacterized protein YnzC (UPF0291/DUF896 family)